MPYKLVELSISAVVETLDDKWQTVGQVRGKLGMPAQAVTVSAVLRQLAAEGLIERKAEPTGIQKSRGRGELKLISIGGFQIVRILESE